MSLTDITRASSLPLAVTLKQRLQDAARARNKVLLLDTSGSMEACDAEGGLSRIAVLGQIVQGLRPRPGRIITFASHAEEISDAGSVPERGSGSTNLSGAFDYIKETGDLTDVILITDGHPDSPERALASAQGLRVSVIYAGPEGRRPRFLDDLVAATGGSFATSASFGKPAELAAQVVRGLLNGGSA